MYRTKHGPPRARKRTHVRARSRDCLSSLHAWCWFLFVTTPYSRSRTCVLIPIFPILCTACLLRYYFVYNYMHAFLVSTFIVPVAAIPIVVHIPPIVVNARFLANFSKLFEQLGVFGMLHTVILASVSGVGTFLNLFGVRLG